MDTRYLIDAIVRQTTVLIAQLSTAAGIRAPLSHVADQVFADLAKQIEAQGVSRKVAADMFGIALRTYQKKVDRLSESASQRGLTLWQAILEFVESDPGVQREAVLRRFAQDGEVNVIAVLNDLVGSGVLHRSGRGETSLYRPTSEEDRGLLARRDAEQALSHMAWLSIYHQGPLDLLSLALHLRVDGAVLRTAVQSLIEDGRVEETDDQRLAATTLYIPVGASRGWEAAVFDHFQGMVTSIGRKLLRGSGSSAVDEVGGGTLNFEIYAGHPDEAEVRGLLARTRHEVNALWARVEARNALEPIPDDQKKRVVFYYGQSHGGGEDTVDE